MAYTLIGEPVYQLKPSPVIQGLADGPVIVLKAVRAEGIAVGFVNYNKESKVPVMTVNYIGKRESRSGSDVMKRYIITDLRDKQPIPFGLAYVHNNVIHNAKSLWKEFAFRRDDASKLLVVSLRKVINEYNLNHPVRHKLMPSTNLAQKRTAKMKLAAQTRLPLNNEYDKDLIEALATDMKPRILERKMTSSPTNRVRALGATRKRNSVPVKASSATMNKAVADIYAPYVLDSKGVPERDYITLSLIPRKYAIPIDKKVYDARGLKQMILNKVITDAHFLANIAPKILVPHTRNKMDIPDIISVLKTVED